MDTKDYIKLNEGLRLKPYRCSAGKLTIGYGRNLEDKGISKEEADAMLDSDMADCIFSLYDIFKLDGYENLTSNRRMVLIDMMFNLGKTRFSKFKKMIQAIKNSDFDEAAKQLLDSRYAKQLPCRSERNAKFMKEG